ncbi:MAG: TIGR03943 family protein [Xenococcaceae cyanobacterium MO_234.B1]|nr:TIGR03943 family protein [Xenococcaceae cyanobacterium MO_234.B1]
MINLQSITKKKPRYIAVYLKKAKQYNWTLCLDSLVFISWGILLLKYAITGEYKLLIHPNYFLLMVVTGILMLLIGVVRGILFLQFPNSASDKEQHLTLFPAKFSSTLLLGVAIAGLIISPNVLTSKTALQRGVAENLPLTSSQPQSFVTTTKSEERSLIDWVRTLNAYPEPDAYQGQPAKVTGFVVHLPELPENYLLISRFIVTCCAVDAYPIGIPVQLEGNRNAYSPDTWLEITGTMTTANLPSKDHQNQRKLVLVPSEIKPIPTPKDPYISNQ